MYTNDETYTKVDVETKAELFNVKNVTKQKTMRSIEKAWSGT